MHISEVAAKRAEWGNKPCDHPSIDKEREEVGGAQTGDFICEQCGKLFFSKRDWENERKARGLKSD